MPSGPLLEKYYLLSSLLRPHVPVLRPLRHFALKLVDWSPCSLGQPTAGPQDLPDVYHHESLTGCLHLYPGCPSSALTRFFLLSGRLPLR